MCDNKCLPCFSPCPKGDVLRLMAMVKKAVRDLTPCGLSGRRGISKYIETRYGIRDDCLVKYVLRWMVYSAILRRDCAGLYTLCCLRHCKEICTPKPCKRIKKCKKGCCRRCKPICFKKRPKLCYKRCCNWRPCPKRCSTLCVKPCKKVKRCKKGCRCRRCKPISCRIKRRKRKCVKKCSCWPSCRIPHAANAKENQQKWKPQSKDRR